MRVSTRLAEMHEANKLQTKFDHCLGSIRRRSSFFLRTLFELMSDPAALRKPKPQYKGRNGFEEEFPPADGTEFNGAALHAEAQKRRMMEWTLEHKGSSIPS